MVERSQLPLPLVSGIFSPIWTFLRGEMVYSTTGTIFRVLDASSKDVLSRGSLRTGRSESRK